MDISLYYEKRGAGEPLVLLHGNGEDGSYFLHQMEAFSREFLVYALDTRGPWALPPGGAQPFTISQFAGGPAGLSGRTGAEAGESAGVQQMEGTSP